ncbi:MAG: MerR family transcriptional regulator [Acidobacteriota bacterium]|nr:MAG: MerR family transcriptional regulator [Acidobacteriota bacterium]
MSSATAKKTRAAQVCAQLQIQPYVLKFWESEFPQLGERLDDKRLYGPRELEIARAIHQLVEVEQRTLAQARTQLAEKFPGSKKVSGRAEGDAEPAPAPERGLELERMQRRADEMKRALAEARAATIEAERRQHEAERARDKLAGELEQWRERHAKLVGELANELDACRRDAAALGKLAERALVALAPPRQGAGATTPETQHGLFSKRETKPDRAG